MATKGTSKFLKEKGIEAITVSKLGLGRPDLMDTIKIGKISLLVNTPSGRKSAQDSSDIRKAAIKYKVPYISTTAAAIAAAKGIAARREEEPKVCPLQEYHANIKQLQD
jgi:carbamoyl-phosphate synthase large subunit